MMVGYFEGLVKREFGARGVSVDQPTFGRALGSPVLTDENGIAAVEGVFVEAVVF